jgi:hypothetical protein
VTDNAESPNLLAVSFAYPPSALPRAIQVERLLRHLNTRTVLICAAYKEKDVRQDETLLRQSESFLERCLRVPFAMSSARDFAARVGYRFQLPLINKIPDQFVPWRRPVLEVVGELLKDYSPDLFVTFGAPMSDHLIGLELKKRLNVPWLAHFSDPWVDNPFAGNDQISRTINRRLEGSVIACADRVLFTSDETTNLVMSKYPSTWRNKARVVSHAFEPNLFSTKPIANSHILVRYLGDFYGPRTPIPLITALKTLLKRNPSSLDNVKFETIGTLGDLRVEDLGLTDLPAGLITIKPHVSYRESLSLMSESNGLLVMDAPARESVFLPSKLIDYIGASRPILGITPPGTAWRLISELGGWVADPSKQEKVVIELERFLSYLRSHYGDQSWGDDSVRRRFVAANVARKFDECVAEALKVGS